MLHLVHRDVDAGDAFGCVAGQEVHGVLRSTSMISIPS